MYIENLNAYRDKLHVDDVISVGNVESQNVNGKEDTMLSFISSSMCILSCHGGEK